MMVSAQGGESWTSRFGRPFLRHDSRSTEHQSDQGLQEEDKEPVDTTSSDALPPSTADDEPDDHHAGERSARGDRDRLPPTDYQIRYIKVLGGDPEDVHTKAEASELIDRLRRLRGPSPLDPYSLEKRGTAAGREAGSDWRSAHDSLLSGLRLDLQQYIDSTLDSLRATLSDACGPGGVRQTFGSQNLVREAKLHLERLRVWQHHGEQDGVPMPEMFSVPVENVDRRRNESKRDFQHFSTGTSDRLVRSEPGPMGHDSLEQPSWWGLIFVVALCVLLESIFNVPLLMSAVRGGVVEAVSLAILVSLINVGGLGVGAGLLFSWLRRQPETRSLAHPATFVVWLVVATGFNLVAGRHREAYARRAELVDREGADAAVTVQALLPDVTFNPLAWEFQALLFALLGMALCAVGFAKGFTFIRVPEVASVPATGGTIDVGGNGPDGSAGTKAPDEKKILIRRHRAVITAYENVLNHFRAGVMKLRDDVAEWYARLDQKRRDMHGTVNVLKEEKNQQACIDCVTHAFISEYNNRHAEKIDLATVEEYREQRYQEPILVTPSDDVILEEAATLAVEWRKSGQAKLEQRITDAQEEMIALWARYEPLVLRQDQQDKSITYGSGASRVDSAAVRQGNDLRGENVAAEGS